MRNYLLLSAAALTLLTSCSDERCLKGDHHVVSEARSISGFHSINAEGSYEITLTKDATSSVRIEAENNLIGSIRTEVHNGTLKIDHRRCLNMRERVRVYISMPELRAATLSGSGSIKSPDTWTSETNLFAAQISGSGEMSFPVTAATVTARIDGSGKIFLSGSADVLSGTISGSGNLHAFDLPCRTADIRISGSGLAEVSPSASLNARISGSGNVVYTGSPSITSDISGSGKVKSR